MGWGDTKAFLEKVVAWPVDDTGYVNLHFSIIDKDGGKDIVTGKPFTSMDKMLSFADWAKAQPNFKEMWYCTSLQSEAGENRNGKPKAIRLHQNAKALKAIWIDIDVKDDPKHYGSLEEAWEAFTIFRREAGLPPPSAIVKSGGGLHIYWLSDRPLTPAEWAPYAHGLRSLLLKHKVRCDAGLTTDDVRLLRLPNTLNHKYTPPRPVELLPSPLVEYDFAEDLEFLAVEPPPSTVALTINPSFIGKTPIAINAVDKLSDGIEQKEELPPLPLAPILAGCAFIRDALETGGADHSQPEWNLITLAATFLEDGHELAHKMGSGHSGYSEDTTNALWERKVRERQDRGLGWPSCAAIEAAGCTSCALCPNRSVVKSPLNLALTAAKEKAEPTRTLPKGYEFNKEGIICKVDIKENKDGTPNTRLLPLFYSKIDSFWVEKDAGKDVLHFRASRDKGNFVYTHISLADMCNGQIGGVLARALVKINPDNKRFLEGFFVSTLAKFHSESEAQETQPFGWYVKDGKTKGFIYGGVVYHDDGTETGAGAGSTMLSEWYRPAGELSAWFDACSTITSLERPELDTLIAVSFASPLIGFTGESMVTVSAYGESGTSKSGAMDVGVAVWGHPVKTKEGKKTTYKSLMNKMGILRNLPAFWDEITDEKSQAHALETLFGGTGEGGRLTVNVEQRDRGIWTCMLATAANISLIDYIVKKQPDHTGGVNRVLEYEVGPNDPTKLGNGTDAARALKALENNYGGMGLKYAQFLAKNVARIDADVQAKCHEIEKKVDITQQDRFWKAGVAALICGATYANELGCKLDVLAMEKFLYATFFKNRQRRDKEGQNNKDSAGELLAAYLKERMNTQTIWTDGLVDTQGRGAKGVTLLHGPPPLSHSRDPVQVRWDVHSATLRFSRRDFRVWLATHANGAGPSIVMRGLTELFTVEEDKKRVLASGTTYNGLPEWVVTIKVSDNSPLFDVMMQYKELKDVTVLPTAQTPAKGEAS